MGNIINKQFLEKTERIWKDNRRYRTRLLISSIVIFSMCFTFIFFGPIELTAFGQESLRFSVSDIIWIMASVAILIFVGLSLVVSLLKGRVFNYVITGFFSFTVCGYIQGNFLNGPLGALTGDEIAWHTQKGGMLINLFVWFVIFIIPYIVLYFHKKGWKNMICFISSALVVMQAVALLTVFINTPSQEDKIKDDNYLTTNEMFQYSKKDNTLVFLLDRLDYDYIEDVLEDDPNFFNELDGFTSYTNAISEHARTRPAANYMLTNCDDLLFKIPAQKYFEDSWSYNNKNILKDINDAGYKTNIYTEIKDMFGSGKTVENYVSNMTHNDSKIDIPGVTAELISLSTYRYAPTSMKPFFWTYTDYVNNNAYVKNVENERYKIDETKYMEGIGEFNISNNDKYFKFYHFNGSHAPYTLDANGKRSLQPTNVVEQTKGSFKILFSAFHKMKELDIYKDASILIVADHGTAVSDNEKLKKAIKIGLFYKPRGVEKIALQNSKAPVSLKNIPAMILKGSDIDYAKYGTPLDEVNEDSSIERTFYKTVVEDGNEENLYTYKITGDAGDFKNWQEIDKSVIEHPYY